MITYKIARKYLDNQWSVIPVVLSLDYNGKVLKKPAIAWREYQQRLPTDTELHTWFDVPKYNGIGLVTGKISRIIVLDVDDPTKIQDLKSPIVAKTISGGFHYYYRWDEELRNDAKIEDKPLDFRGDGGFVVLPPSNYLEQRYEWVSETAPMFLLPLPVDIKKLLKVRKEVPQAPVNEVQGSLGLPMATEGNRNDTAARVAGIICKSISKKLLPIIGYKTFALWNRTSCTPPLDERELQATWESIYNAELRNNPEKVEYSVFTGSAAIEEYKVKQAKYGQGISTGISQLDVFFRFLPEQLYLLSSQTHQGKTSLALNMASFISKTGKHVLFASLEQGIFIAPRVESILKENFPDTLSILTTHAMITVKEFIDIIGSQQVKPDVVFIDHLHFIKKEGKGVTEDIDKMILDLQNMAKELQIPVFVIAHVRKINADRPPDLDDLRDSSSLAQVPSVVMLLYRQKNTDESRQRSYLSTNGTLLIAKNRIQGKTGVLNFSIEEGGEFIFYEQDMS